jgi:hypothetical protein
MNNIIILNSGHLLLQLSSFFRIFWETSSPVVGRMRFCLRKDKSLSLRCGLKRQNYIYLGIKILFQMLEEISEEVGVRVFAELIKNKPVTKITAIQDTLASGEVRVSETSGLDENQDISEIYIKKTYI